MRRVAASFLFAALLASSAYGWPGFDWNEWQAATGVTKPEVSGPQAGTMDVVPVLGDIESPEQWEVRKAEILSVLNAFVGAPTPMEAPEPAAEILGSEDMGTYMRTHLRIASEADDTIPAYLLKPKEMGGTPVPVMIVLHQTQAPGKAEACGMTGDPEMAFAKELAERGVMCIAPDAIGFGERIAEGGSPYDGAMDFYKKHPNWSFFGKMCWDVSRVIDYLETLPEVDKDKIGVIGHSHGAYGSIMAAVFEPRVSLAVASCGFTTLRTDPDPNRWSHLTALLPRLGFYVDDIAATPFEWSEIIACIAPRPCFYNITLNDDIFPNTSNLPAVLQDVNGVYGLYDLDDELAWSVAPGKHRFPAEVRAQAYRWLNQEFALMP